MPDLIFFVPRNNKDADALADTATANADANNPLRRARVFRQPVH